jgi:ribosomal protein S18 acetylase RimI-like enzyme
MTVLEASEFWDSHIQPLTRLNPTDLPRLITGYTTHAVYRPTTTESDTGFTISLERTELDKPIVKRYDHLDAETVERYEAVMLLGHSFGAYEGDECVGIAIAEPMQWNRSLWVWELHVAESYRGRGIGRALVDKLAAKGRAADLRTIVCETQNTNAPAIAFYRRAGFAIEGIDLSYYTNQDYPDGEIAIFMKRRLE